MNELDIISATRNWLTDFIIAYNICPFARREHEKDSIRYQVLSGDTADFLTKLIEECDFLESNPTTETTLLIVPEGLADFDDFLDFTAIADQLLLDQGYEGIYQLASFHPDYCFAEEDHDDPANYTNRSPYPMLHIIREASIELALSSWPNPEQIPERNIKLTRELGLEKLRRICSAHRANH